MITSCLEGGLRVNPREITGMAWKIVICASQIRPIISFSESKRIGFFNMAMAKRHYIPRVHLAYHHLREGAGPYSKVRVIHYLNKVAVVISPCPDARFTNES